MNADQDERFNIAHIEPTTHIYGSGKNFTIWLQGCTLACQGCWNKEMWPTRPHTLRHRAELLQQILATPDITGVTLLGGEPMQQSHNTLWLLAQLRSKTNLNTMLYTGYEAGELEAMGHWQFIEQTADIVVAGRYEQEKRNTDLRWRGSTNQQLIYPVNSRLVPETEEANQVEIIISEHGGMTVLGYPDLNTD